MDLQEFLLCGVLGIAGFVRGVSGFAFGLLTMALLPQFLDVHIATTLVAILQLFAALTLLIYYRQSFKLEAVGRLATISALAVPIGVVAATNLNEGLILEVLGILTAGYALYALCSPQLPQVNESPAWIDCVGLASGLLTGAYNTGGPPLVIYSEICQWEKNQFKVNVQALSILDGALAVLSHGLNQELTTDVWRLSLITLPGLCVGLGLGILMSKFISDWVFKKIVLVFLLLIGLKLIAQQVGVGGL